MVLTGFNPIGRNIFADGKVQDAVQDHLAIYGHQSDYTAVCSGAIVYDMVWVRYSAQDFIVVLVCFFPITAGFVQGLVSTEPELDELLQVMRATPAQILWKVGCRRQCLIVFGAEDCSSV